MSKSSLWNRILHIRVKTCLMFILCSIAVIILVTHYGVYNYKHIEPDEISQMLYIKRIPNLKYNRKLPKCEFDHVLENTNSVVPYDIPQKFDSFSPDGIVNGTYIPTSCNPVISVAIIVAYRNRQNQLDVFLPYIHNFLRKQDIHYKIYVVEQLDQKIFNKGILLNIGAKHAKSEKFPCLIIQDVDMLPLDSSILYACTQTPRHVSASLDKFRYVLTYYDLVGGVFAIRTDQFFQINGLSNKFEGWGGEDDDFKKRMDYNDLGVVRFPREMARYTMLVHPQEKKNSMRMKILNTNVEESHRDGVNNVQYESVQVKPHRLFTLIGVRI